MTASSRAIPKQASVWGERRNTSRVHPVPPNALPDALRALAAFRRHDPALARWVGAGAPTLTERDHLERFGEPYTKRRAPK